MPIVDGLTSTKMIRAHEQANPDNLLSPLAALNGRVPIIAVSASLVEKERETYIDAGFDAWILKPISFDRLNELMHGIVDAQSREQALYKPGEWERGGWFAIGLPKAQNVLKSDSTVDGVPGDSHQAATTESEKEADSDASRRFKSHSEPLPRVEKGLDGGTVNRQLFPETVLDAAPVESPAPMDR
jgi:DNA-binding response OmpR family regulator